MIVARQLEIRYHTINRMWVGLLFIITVLIGHIQDDVHAAKCSQCQPKDVDEAVAFIPG
jgi:hypothetical protein